MKTLEILGHPEVDTDVAYQVALNHLRGTPRGIPEFSGWESAFKLVSSALIQLKDGLEICSICHGERCFGKDDPPSLRCR